MCYQPDFLTEAWAEYLRDTGMPEDQVDPDAFVRWTYARALAHRQPRYRGDGGELGRDRHRRGHRRNTRRRRLR